MNARELLLTGLQELNLSCSETQLQSFMTYIAELKKWNKAYNLTALETDEDIIIKHFLDSLLYLRALPGRHIKLADAGSGAGFPGIPLKIIKPDIEVWLIEASRKKTSFLRSISLQLKLSDITVVQQRIEHLGKRYDHYFDVIVSRATFSITEFIRIACPYVKDKGILVLNKGPKVEQEKNELLAHSDKRSSAMQILTLPVPMTMMKRHIVILPC